VATAARDAKRATAVRAATIEAGYSASGHRDETKSTEVRVATIAAIATEAAWSRPAGRRTWARGSRGPSVVPGPSAAIVRTVAIAGRGPMPVLPERSDRRT
jgi:hypothetical protein